MSFRNKLIIVFCSTILVSISIAIFTFDKSVEKITREQTSAKALSIASSVAALIDGDQLKGIQSRDDEKSKIYSQIKTQLKEALLGNRRQDTYVKQLYTVFPSPQDPNILLSGINPAEELEYSSHVGDVLHLSNIKNIDLKNPFSPEETVQDQWGIWTIAFAPIKDQAGNVVAAIAVEIPATRLAERLASIHSSGAIALGIGLVLALLCALVIARSANKPLAALKEAIDQIGQGKLDARVNIKNKDEFGSIANSVNKMAEGLKERETVKSAFARYVSQQVLDSVIHSGKEPSIRGDRRKITALFADIRGFTTLSESHSPEVVVEILNQYFDKMVDIIFKHHGTLDKFIGDGLMVIFGAPVDDQYQEQHAVLAALEMQLELGQLRGQWLKDHGIDLKIGIGINSGSAIVGNIGSSKRMEYTAIGDTVNLAARLESATKDVGVDILISDYTYLAVRGLFKTQKIGEIQVKGRSEPVVTYSVQPKDPVAAKPEHAQQH